MLATLTRLFPLWALLLSVLAYYTPTTFTPIGPWVTTLLMLIMFGMGVHRKRTARAVLTGRCYSVGSVMRQGSSSLTRLTGQSAMTSSTWRR